ncbi:M28 family metallopeptidase [Deinococcus koreensis]|uniref:Peptidase M28 n=1 Tax=Deinococcus koreensis TaxID=2054903 RepID=A0A2K3V074_9DEIO|nr:M28 family metallopeptidase [Deinococcus koreensis]PNY82194.1 peptidase M28 [Deinococcus koreensis]
MRQLIRPALAVTVLAVPLLLGSASATLDNDAQTILNFGPRVAGSPANEQARAYLEAQFRALGYETRRQDFSYPRFDDLGSDVKLGERVLGGNALQNSTGGTLSGPVVRVPGVGTTEEFARVDVRGKVAVVARGEIPFAQKARNALAAGAAGLVIVNNADGELRGTLGDRVALPVLGVSPTVGAALIDGAAVTLSVRVREGEVKASNVIAYKSGVTAPELLFGAHMDSVQGAPGANDNLSGTLSVLEIARRAANTPLAARAYFLLFDGEEDGLLGSRAFVKDNAPLVGTLKAMFNLDMVGVDVTPLSLTGDSKLVEAARGIAGVQASAGQPGGSDHVPFAQAGIPTLFFHRGLDKNYHQPGDKVLDPALVSETVEVALKVADSVLSATPVR